MAHTHTTFTYRIVTWLLFPVALAYTVFLSLRYKNFRYLRQRCGFFSTHESLENIVWLHCASVGEVNTALPLIKKLSSKQINLLISTSTITGQEALQKSLPSNSECIFLPLDYAYFAKQLIKQYRPSACLLFETELWPNIVMTAHHYSIPVAIINGRISHKTLNAPSFVRKNYLRVLAQVKTIIASSQENADHFISLGASKNNVSTLDNLKFAVNLKETNSNRPLERNYFLCASTHANEEEQILQHWQSKHSLVFAPRHPKRTQEVCSTIQKLGFNYVLHSQKPTRIDDKTIYVIDMLGELMPFIQHAQAVFIGGTLIPLGGHNVLEPASMGKCILVGPHLANIETITNELTQQKAIIITNDAAQICQQYLALESNPELRNQYGNNAKIFVKSKQNILEDYVDAVEAFIKAYS